MTDDKTRIPDEQGSAQPDVSEIYPYDTPKWRSIKKGTAIGFAVGLGLAQFIVTTHLSDSPIGAYYQGNVILVFGGWIVLGSAAGAGLGWLFARRTELL